MKKLTATLFTALLLLSMTACSSTPSNDKIKAALDEGTITVEDAKAKGWIDDEWVKANFEQMDAKSKIYLLAPFETTYLDGTVASSTLIEGKMCLVFINELTDGTAEKLDEFNRAYEEMNAAGVPILGIVSDDNDTDTATERLKNVTFPIIVRNEDMQRSLALSGFDTMLDYDVVSVFTKDGGIYTAWRNGETTEELIDYAKDLAHED